MYVHVHVCALEHGHLRGYAHVCNTCGSQRFTLDVEHSLPFLRKGLNLS